VDEHSGASREALPGYQVPATIPEPADQSCHRKDQALTADVHTASTALTSRPLLADNGDFDAYRKYHVQQEHDRTCQLTA
jgi:hypothetical protein